MPNTLANTQDLVDIDEIKESTVLLKNGRLVQVLMVEGINFSLKSEEEQNIIISSYQSFLNGLEFPIQVIVHSRKINIESYLAVLDKRQREEQSPLLQNQISEYREFITSFVKDNAIMEKTFFLTVTFTPVSLPSKSSVGRFIPFFGKKDKAAETKATEQKLSNFQHNLSQLKQRTEQIVSGLRTIGLETILLENEGLAELFYNFYNPGAVERQKMGLIQTTEKDGGE